MGLGGKARGAERGVWGLRFRVGEKEGLGWGIRFRVNERRWFGV
jgi:hypothetical protein